MRQNKGKRFPYRPGAYTGARTGNANGNRVEHGNAAITATGCGNADSPDGNRIGSAAGSGYTGYGNGNVSPTRGKGPGCHRFGSFPAHHAEFSDVRSIHGKKPLFGLDAVRHKTAPIHVRRTGNGGQNSPDEAASQRLRGNEGKTRQTEPVKQFPRLISGRQKVQLLRLPDADLFLEHLGARRKKIDVGIVTDHFY